MRVLIMFDLPVVSQADRKEYTRFRKYLIKNGFLMMQESIYCKLAQNTTAADALIDNVRKNKPLKGLVQAMKITEKQYSKIEYIVGESSSEVIDTDEWLVIL
jgi:CRISPR-associated protein Cas2